MLQLTLPRLPSLGLFFLAHKPTSCLDSVVCVCAFSSRGRRSPPLSTLPDAFAFRIRDASHQIVLLGSRSGAMREALRSSRDFFQATSAASVMRSVCVQYVCTCAVSTALVTAEAVKRRREEAP